ncbi:MAG TPA: hypothetical protein VIL49_14465 [Capillimicrobium sp.]|jgi:hypothetical protein
MSVAAPVVCARLLLVGVAWTAAFSVAPAAQASDAALVRHAGPAWERVADARATATRAFGASIPSRERSGRRAIAALQRYHRVLGETNAAVRAQDPSSATGDAARALLLEAGRTARRGCRQAITGVRISTAAAPRLGDAPRPRILRRFLRGFRSAMRAFRTFESADRLQRAGARALQALNVSP